MHFLLTCAYIPYNQSYTCQQLFQLHSFSHLSWGRLEGRRQEWSCLCADYKGFVFLGNESVVETAVYQGAQECLTLLSNRLGDSQYMFGRSARHITCSRHFWAQCCGHVKFCSPLRQCCGSAVVVSQILDPHQPPCGSRCGSGSWD